jgi:hypothetical protein
MSKMLSPHQKASVRTDGSNLEQLIKLPHLFPNTQWIGGYKLGEGSFGIATLWVLVDNITLKAVAHAVIKDAFEATWLSTVEAGLYTGVYLQLVEKGLDFGADPTHALGQAAPGLRFLKEAYLQGLMTVPNATEEIYAVPLFGYARKLLDPPHAPGHNHWRLFAPLYDFGDLQSLIYAHMYKAQAIPEPFIWHTLICLMKAAVQFEQQAQLRPGERTPSDVIVVFDMKPANILLGRPNRTSTFPIYPRPHIADLGGGCLTNQLDPANLSDQMKFTHTPGYLAPEMSRCLPQEVLRGTCTNVWQIGRVLEVMMKLIPDDFEDIDYRFRPGMVPADLEPRIVNYNYWLPAQKYYSDTLKQTVAACLRLKPADRPSPQVFLASVDNLKPLFRGLDTFGNDAWFADRQRNRAAMPRRPEPRTTAETTEFRAAEAEKQRRVAKAWPYLRVWGPDRAAEYADLGVFPPEHDEVLYDGEANWWATDPADFIWQSGLPVYPPVVVPPTVHPPAVESSSSAGIL